MNETKHRLLAKTRFVFFLFPVSWCCLLQAQSATVTGTVLEKPDLKPSVGARVRVQAATSFVVTATEGTFTLEVADDLFSPIITGGKKGYYNAQSFDLISGATRVTLELQPIPTDRDPDFQFSPPMSCQGCHTEHFADWAGLSGGNRPSRHSTAGKNVWVRDLYDGSGTPAGNGGYVFVRDSPIFDPSLNPEGLHTSGLCAECHLPSLAALAPVSGTVLLSQATPESPLGSPERHAFDNGIFCDVCHKTFEVNDRLGRTAFFGNAVGLFSEPGLLFGPLDDAPMVNIRMLSSFNDLFHDSRICASCHQYNMDHDFDGDFDDPGSPPGQSTYVEWLNSPYAEQGIQCQHCHMPSPEEGPVQICVFGGADRVPDQAHSHRFEGTTLPFLQAAVDLVVEASRNDEVISVRVDVTNVGAGHNFPTGVSVRNALLVVRARTRSGTELPWLPGTSLVPDWGGIGDGGDDYGKKPGRGFAKILRGHDGRERVLFIDAVELVSNTQIPPKQTDRSRYRFNPTGVEDETISIEARILYRRAWKDVAEAKGWIGGVDGQGYPYEGDVLVKSETLLLAIPPTPVPRLDPPTLLGFIRGWHQGDGNPSDLLFQQLRWYAVE